MGQAVSKSTQFEGLGSPPLAGYTSWNFNEVLPEVQLNRPWPELLQESSLQDVKNLLNEYKFVWITDDTVIYNDNIVFPIDRLSWYTVSVLYHRAQLVTCHSPVNYHLLSRRYQEVGDIMNSLLQFLLTKGGPDLFSSGIVRLYGEMNDKPLTIQPHVFREFVGRVSGNNAKLALSGFRLDATQISILVSTLEAGACLELDPFSSMADDGAAFVDALQRNEGPTQLSLFVDSVAFWDAVSENTRLKKLSLIHPVKAFPEFAVMLARNQALESLDVELSSAERVPAFLESFKSHPTLEDISAGIHVARYHMRHGKLCKLKDRHLKKLRTRHTRMVIGLLETNTVIKTISLVINSSEGHGFDEDIFHAEVQPRLEINRARPRIQEVTSTTNGAKRCKLVGETLLDFRCNLSLVWLLVRELPTLVVDRLCETEKWSNRSPQSRCPSPGGSPSSKCGNYYL